MAKPCLARMECRDFAGMNRRSALLHDPTEDAARVAVAGVQLEGSAVACNGERSVAARELTFPSELDVGIWKAHCGGSVD